MIERFVEIPTKAGKMETFVTHPSENGPFPAVVLYMDIWGLREELFDIARHVASVGYYVVVPDLYITVRAKSGMPSMIRATA